MKVLVTGGFGLVGRALQADEKVLQAKKDWIFLSSKDGDLRDLKVTETIFEKYQPTHVIHLAAHVGGLYENMNKNQEFFTDNMRINLNVLSCAHKYKVKKIISCLSTCIYPDGIETIDETTIHNGPPHYSNYGYATAKRFVDTMNHIYSTEDSVFTSIIPCNIYGEFDNFNLVSGHVIPSLIHKCYMSKLNGLPFEVMGDGSALRQFIYSKDLAKLIIWVLENYNSTEPLILCGNDETTIKDVAEKIASVFNQKIIQYVPADNGQHKKKAINKKLTELIDFRFTPLEQGITNTIQWFTENYNEVRK